MGFFSKSSSKKNSASIAKERLKIIISHEQRSRRRPSYLPQLREEIVEVVKKYVSIDSQDINIQVSQENECEVLELNIVLPESR